MSDRTPADRLAAERTNYGTGSLADEAANDPLALFDAWMAEAFERRESHGDLAEPTAVVLSTIAVGTNGGAADGVDGGVDRVIRPRSRTVLLKGRDERGFVLYTNLDSDKGREVDANPSASLLLPWYPLQRQVRIEGLVEPVDPAKADAYFASRPRGSQISAWASRQSRPVDSRAALEVQYTAAQERFEGADVPRPPFWGGLRLVPDRIEFWQGRENRLHDRIVVTRVGVDEQREAVWEQHRLQP
ncbi:pyridoxamine 5'-phosphate oxidase [Brachybacterium muris]|uniref:pyridoxamine 5'-phosphate oxidase n=1 Tax=Brachybacterium muris TaxID=219301 RepID=UPI0021A50069|nr:pyridoxamine 5'-phosphate oxidase [Brachybacterium muris]MCT1431907.1 pyridoxamine 5'-phosphate oxidase [Brachybacterium muris]